MPISAGGWLPSFFGRWVGGAVTIPFLLQYLWELENAPSHTRTHCTHAPGFALCRTSITLPCCMLLHTHAFPLPPLTPFFLHACTAHGTFTACTPLWFCPLSPSLTPSFPSFPPHGTGDPTYLFLYLSLLLLPAETDVPTPCLPSPLPLTVPPETGQDILADSDSDVVLRLPACGCHRMNQTEEKTPFLS